MRRRLLWKLYVWLLNHCPRLAWRLHGAACPDWCQGHSAVWGPVVG